MLGRTIILCFTILLLISIILLLKRSLPEHHEYTLKSFNGFISLWLSNERLGLQFVKIKKGIYTTFFVSHIIPLSGNVSLFIVFSHVMHLSMNILFTAANFSPNKKVAFKSTIRKRNHLPPIVLLYLKIFIFM